MIEKLVQSALRTGWLSVESEGLICQMLQIRGCQSVESDALHQLSIAIQTGQIQREAHGMTSLLIDP
jgi:hypothetical protein